MPTATRRKSSAGGGLSRDAAIRLAQKWLSQRRQLAERGREPKGQVAEAVRHEKETTGRRDKKEAARGAVDIDVPRWGPSECQASPECLKQYITSPDVAHLSVMLLDKLGELTGKWWEVPGGGRARRIGYMYNRVSIDVDDSASPNSAFRTPVESREFLLGRTDGGNVFGFYVYENRRERPRLREVFFRADCDRECVERIKRLAAEAPGEVTFREGPEAYHHLYEYDFGDTKLYVFEHAGSYIVVEAVHGGKSLGSGAVYSPVVLEEELAETVRPVAERLSAAVGKSKARQILETALTDIFNLPEFKPLKDTWLPTIKKVIDLAFKQTRRGIT